MPPNAGDIGFWGRCRRDFLREHRPITFNRLVLSGEQFKHLAQVNQEATEQLEILIQGMKEAQDGLGGVDEQHPRLRRGDHLCRAGVYVMKDKINSLNTYFWNVENDIADIRLLEEGALALLEGDAEPLHLLELRHNAEAAASAFDTIGTALYDLSEKIAGMQQRHMSETIRQGEDRTSQQ